MDAESPVVTVDRQPAAGGLDAFAHAQEAESAARAARCVTDAVLHGDADPAVVLAHVHCCRPLSVPVGVRECFLDDPVDRHADAGLHETGGEVDGGTDVETDALEGGDEAFQAAERRGRPERLVVGDVVSEAEEREDPLRFDDDGTGAGPGRDEGLPGGLGVFGQPDLRGTEMHAQHRDLVADDVVEVPGDAQAFLGHPSGGFDLAGGDGALGPFLQGEPVLPVDAQRGPVAPPAMAEKRAAAPTIAPPRNPPSVMNAPRKNAATMPVPTSGCFPLTVTENSTSTAIIHTDRGSWPTAVTAKDAALVTTSPAHGLRQERATPTPARSTERAVGQSDPRRIAATIWPVKTSAATE